MVISSDLVFAVLLKVKIYLLKITLNSGAHFQVFLVNALSFSLPHSKANGKYFQIEDYEGAPGKDLKIFNIIFNFLNHYTNM